MVSSQEARTASSVKGQSPRLDDDERRELSDVVEVGTTLLAFVFLGILLIELTADLSPERTRRLELAGLTIWGIFALDFFVRLAVSEHKVGFIVRNPIAVLALFLPAFRTLRVLRAFRIARSLRLARIVTRTNRSTRALRRLLEFGGAAYVFILTAVILVIAAAGISSLERAHPGATIDSFWEGLWWALTTLVTLTSEHHPATVEGRILAGLVMVYGLAISGYITALLAVVLLGRRNDASDQEIVALRDEIRSLREELRAQMATGETRHPGAGRASTVR